MPGGTIGSLKHKHRACPVLQKSGKPPDYVAWLQQAFLLPPKGVANDIHASVGCAVRTIPDKELRASLNGMRAGTKRAVRREGAYLRNIVLMFKEPMATEAHGKHGIYKDNFCVFRGFRGCLSRFRFK